MGIPDTARVPAQEHDMSTEHLKLSPEKLTTICDPDTLGFETTAEVSPLEGTIGQERASSALELALDIDAPGQGARDPQR